MTNENFYVISAYLSFPRKHVPVETGMEIQKPLRHSCGNRNPGYNVYFQADGK